LLLKVISDPVLQKVQLFWVRETLSVSVGRRLAIKLWRNDKDILRLIKTDTRGASSGMAIMLSILVAALSFGLSMMPVEAPSMQSLQRSSTPSATVLKVRQNLL
jgi:hypothetical protein